TSEPPVVTLPSISIRSLSAIGIPCSGRSHAPSGWLCLPLQQQPAPPLRKPEQRRGAHDPGYGSARAAHRPDRPAKDGEHRFLTTVRGRVAATLRQRVRTSLGYRDSWECQDTSVLATAVNASTASAPTPAIRNTHRDRLSWVASRHSDRISAR